jgi:uncharacterized Zn ribbon protein
MANAFKVKTFDGSATGANTDMTIYTCPASTETTIIGMTLANLTGSQVTVDVKLNNNDGDNVFVVKDAPVPTGSSLVVVGGDQKVVLEASDAIVVQSDTANSIDTVLSILEIT